MGVRWQLGVAELGVRLRCQHVGLEHRRVRDEASDICERPGAGLVVMGFSPRKTDLTFYIPLPGGFDKNKPLMGKLGKYKTGKGCLYVKRLEDIDVKVLTSLIERAAKAEPASP